MGKIVIGGVLKQIPCDENEVLQTDGKLFQVVIFSVGGVNYEIFGGEEYNVSAFDDKQIPFCLLAGMLGHQMPTTVIEDGQPKQKMVSTSKIIFKKSEKPKEAIEEIEGNKI